VLLLDEPTNDLDIDTLAALEDILDGWPGTLLVASHDRYLIERTCDTVVALPGTGTLLNLPGGVDQYLSTMDTTPAEKPAIRPDRPDTVDPRTAKKELARLERHLDRLSRQVAELHERLTLHATDYEKVTALDSQLRELEAEQTTTEDAWLALAERLPPLTHPPG
jgi:ABC transport system ATP-binding/permease protein